MTMRVQKTQPRKVFHSRAQRTHHSPNNAMVKRTSASLRISVLAVLLIPVIIV